MSGKNVGDLLNARDVTWGWFQGGFTPTHRLGRQGRRLREVRHHDHEHRRRDAEGLLAAPLAVPVLQVHLEPAPPAAELACGDRAHRPGQPPVRPDRRSTPRSRHDNLPAVCFLKAPEAQDGHAGYSDPLDEQKFLVNEINAIQKSKSWSSTAVVVAYDDSDGWYDHVAPKVTERLDRRRRRLERLHQRPHGRRRLRRPLRPEPAPAVAGDLAVRGAEPRRPHADRAGLDPALHREQLAAPGGSATRRSTPARARSAACSTGSARSTGRCCSRRRPVRSPLWCRRTGSGRAIIAILASHSPCVCEMPIGSGRAR